MKLTRLEAENFKKLTAIDIHFGDGVTEISGPNGVGKSSTFDCIDVCLEGMSVAPPEPIKLGADQSFLRSHFKDDADSGLIITRRFRRGAEGKTISDFSLETPAGARYPSPQAHLDKIIGDHMMDPLQFIEMKDKEQFDVLRSFVPGFDFEQNEQLYAGTFAKRKDINRDQKKAQAAADVIVVPPGTPDKPHDIAALSADIEAAVKHNADVEQRKTNRAAAVARIAELRQSAADLIVHIDDDTRAIEKKVNESVAEIERQIEEMKQRINRIVAQATIDIAENRQVRETEAAQRTKDADALQARIDAAGELLKPIEETTIQAKREQITDAQRVNNNVAIAKRKAEHQSEANRLEKESESLTAQLTELEQAKQEAIQKSSLPVDGLGFGDGFITLKGVRFSQCSTAEKLRTAFAISIAKRPKLRLCWIRDASLLDDNSLQIVADLAREYDCQVLLETVRPNSSNAIVLEDGHVKGVELQPKLTAVTKLAAGAASESTQATDAPQTKSKRRWQGPGAPTGDVDNV